MYCQELLQAKNEIIRRHQRIKLIIVILGKITEMQGDHTKIDQADFYQINELC
jgi:hypothetical protein